VYFRPVWCTFVYHLLPWYTFVYPARQEQGVLLSFQIEVFLVRWPKMD
jgi:hypothetical protein